LEHKKDLVLFRRQVNCPVTEIIPFTQFYAPGPYHKTNKKTGNFHKYLKRNGK
jgi:hypothetical protein